ncbi:MAG: sigma-54-dependent Fis family transcriptional regulator [Myxococcales bacterium]|nr:sigma-54-dependent Fis family transcriptional regulator [Myxococcales bacterium]
MESTTSTPRALVVEDDLDGLKAVAMLAAKEGLKVETAVTLAEARERLAEGDVDVALLDVNLPDGDGFELLPELSRRAGTAIIFVTGNGSVDSAVRALKGGASDFLEKPVSADALRNALRRVIGTRSVRREIDDVRSEVTRVGRLGSLIGASDSMQRIFDLIVRVAPTDATVMVSGPTGTGKELVAQTVHQMSQRSDHELTAVNCGAIAPTLIEAELFGHEKGAFTGADRRRKGLFERASGGTLFLDEVTEMPLEMQVKLLRVLETGKVQRLGSETLESVDTRVVAATNRDPKQAVSDGKLREDLYYRLRVFPIELPPLCDRLGDVRLLAENFLSRCNQNAGSEKTLSEAAFDALEAHAWPGNVRELAHVIARGHILAAEQIEPEHLLFDSPAGSETEPEKGPHLRIKVGSSIEDAERKMILATLEELGGDKPQTAELLGISLKTLYNRLNAYKEDGLLEA